jgi:predicted RNase H-like HicB family nuclease
MGTKKTYTVTYERDADGWWVAEVKELPECHTQGKSIAQARDRIREAMELFDVPRSVELEEIIQLKAPMTNAELRKLREKREDAERRLSESVAATKSAVVRLAKAGLSRRDIGELLGLSFQRVQQLAEK